MHIHTHKIRPETCKRSNTRVQKAKKKLPRAAKDTGKVSQLIKFLLGPFPSAKEKVEILAEPSTVTTATITTTTIAAAMEEAKAKLTEINLSDDPAVTLTIRLIMQGKVGLGIATELSWWWWVGG